MPHCANFANIFKFHTSLSKYVILSVSLYKSLQICVSLYKHNFSQSNHINVQGTLQKFQDANKVFASMWKFLQSTFFILFHLTLRKWKRIRNMCLSKVKVFSVLFQFKKQLYNQIEEKVENTFTDGSLEHLFETTAIFSHFLTPCRSNRTST